MGARRDQNFCSSIRTASYWTYRALAACRSSIAAIGEARRSLDASLRYGIERTAKKPSFPQDTRNLGVFVVRSEIRTESEPRTGRRAVRRFRKRRQNEDTGRSVPVSSCLAGSFLQRRTHDLKNFSSNFSIRSSWSIYRSSI